MTRFVSLLLVLCIFLCVPRAKAGCVDYLDYGTAFCSAEGGCEGSYPIITCGLGFISGRCFNGPNGGLCCGSSFDVAQIYPEGDSCDGPIGIFGRRHHRNKKIIARGLKNKPEVALMSYNPPRMIFVPSRCEHVYEVVFENYAPVVAKGN